MTDINCLRISYYKAVQSEAHTDTLISIITKLQHKNYIQSAYLAGLYALKAKHHSNPYQKIKYLQKANEDIKPIVILHPDDMEVRFIRLSYQYYVPRFLGFSAHLQDDTQAIARAIILCKFNYTDFGLVTNIIDFLKKSKLINTNELAKIEKAMAKYWTKI
ncbi:MAG: hypothetical protein NW207_11800 [Cytophagales bacterium]|nr:hypothetical protein [Cytophagales bacterium]